MQRPRAGQLGHTCIRVKDLAATVKFYNGLLGMPIVEHKPDRVAALGSQENYLEVFPIRPDVEMADVDPQALRLNHFCLWMEGLEELEGRAAAAGHPFTGPIKPVAAWIGAALQVAWVVDPDGNRVELLEWMGPAPEGI